MQFVAVSPEYARTEDAVASFAEQAAKASTQGVLDVGEFCRVVNPNQPVDTAL